MVTIQGLLQDCRSNSITSGYFLGVIAHVTAWAQAGECAFKFEYLYFHISALT